MTTTPMQFCGAAGRRLSGRLETAIGPRRGAVLFVHCFTCGKASLPAVRLSRALAARGFDTLRFDFAGLGESEGDFAETTFTTNLEDIRGAARAMAEAGLAPDLLVGHSLGGAAALAAASDVASLRAVAAIGAPADLRGLERLLGDSVATIEAEGVAEVRLGGLRPARIGRDFLHELRRRDLPGAVRALKLPLLLMHAPEDEVVGIENGLRLFELANQPKSLVALDGGDHLLSDPEVADYAAGVLCAWAQRRLPARAAAPLAEGVVDVAETGAGGFQVEVVTASGAFFADEPPAAGGLGSGPTPYELLAAALGGCTVMTLRLYARRKNWSLERVTVRVAHRRQDGRDAFERQLSLAGELSEEQRARLLEIAGRCPVHRTLAGGADLATTLGPAEPRSGAAKAHAMAMAGSCDESA